MQSAAARYTALTGEAAYLYTSAPGDGGHRFVFTDRVCLGLGAALDYARQLRAQAEQDHREAARAAEHKRSIESMKDIT